MINIKLVQLNNKSRKGQYVRITEEGTKPVYYKYKKGTHLDLYKKRYIQTHKTSKITINKKLYNESIRRYVNKVTKQGKIEQIISKGRAECYLQDIKNTTQGDILQARQKILKNLIDDKQIRNLVAKQENFNKLKNRLEIKATITDKQGNTILQQRTFNKTIEQAIDDLKKVTQKHKKHQYLKWAAQILKLRGWRDPEQITQGTIHKIQLKVIFTK